MSKIKQFDKPTARDLREKIDAALEQLGKELGLKLHAGSASFSNSLLTFKLECAVISEGGEVATKEAADFKRFQSRHGIPLECLNKEFTLQGSKYILRGYKPRGRSYPMIAECSKTGQSFKLPLDQVLRAFDDKVSQYPALMRTEKFNEIFRKDGKGCLSNQEPRIPETEEECKEWFKSLVGRLSPENLACDGEISVAEVNQRRRDILAEWAELESIMGRKVTQEEAEDWAYPNTLIK